MSAAHATVDLDDTDGLLEADRDGLLRFAAMAGAQVRAMAAAVDEGALETLASDQRPRTVIWLAGRGPAEAAGSMLAAALGTVPSVVVGGIGTLIVVALWAKFFPALRDRDHLLADHAD